MPFGAIGGEETDAVAGLYAEFNKGSRQAGDAAEKFLRGDGLPAAVPANHLRARVRKIINGVREACRSSWPVGHFTSPFWVAQCGAWQAFYAARCGLLVAGSGAALVDC